jgi:hypothetical protein
MFKKKSIIDIDKLSLLINSMEYVKKIIRSIIKILNDSISKYKYCSYVNRITRYTKPQRTLKSTYRNLFSSVIQIEFLSCPVKFDFTIKYYKLIL